MITNNLKVSISYDDEASVFVSHCPALNVYSQGRNEKEADRAAASAIFMYLKVCHDRGSLGRVLGKRGFVSAGDESKADDESKSDEAEFVSTGDSETWLLR